MVGTLEAHQRDPLPIIAGRLPCDGIRFDDVGPGVGIRIRLQGAVIPADKAIHATAVHNLHLDHVLGLLVLVIHQHHVDMHRSVQDSVIGIRPERQHLVRREALKGQLSALVVWVQPGLTANPGAFSHRAEGAPKTRAQGGVQGICIGRIFRVKRKWAAKGVVGLLVYHFGV